MSQPHLEIMFRKGKAVAAYLRVAGQRRVATSRQVRPTIVADLDEEGALLGLELLDPRHTEVEEVQRVLAELHASAVAVADLAPLRAA